jgi:DNA-directed RNA polymerase specialized sigma24 family protein
MKAVTYLITPTSGTFGRIGRFFRDNGVWLVGIRHVEQLHDDSMVIQFDVATGADHLRELLSPAPSWVHDFQLAPGEEGPTLQLHFDATGAAREMFELHRSYAVSLEYPIEIADPASQALRVTEVGHEAELRDLVAATRESIDVTIEQVGEYSPVDDGALDRLTQRQRAVLATALDLGYYDDPREVTQADIAAAMECSASAVGQHLRRAEGEVLSAVASPERLRAESGDGPVG